MKNLIIVMLFISGLSFAQETYTFKSGGRVFENGKRLTTADVETYFGHKPEIIKLYNKGMNKKHVGNFLFYSGLISTGFGLSSISKEGKAGGVLLVAGVVSTIISIPVKIGYPKKIKKSILLMNEEIKSQKQNTGLNLETNIIANTNGVGLKIIF